MSKVLTADDVALAVRKTQQFLEPVNSVTTTVRQKLSLKDPGVRGPAWISKTAFQVAPDSNLCQIVEDAISLLGDGCEKYSPAPLSHVPVEWVGHRPGPRAEDLEPQHILSMSSSDKYKSMMQEVSNDVVTLYVPGGAFYFNGPHTVRRFTTRLAQLTGGRCLAIQPRLAPQNPFPAALIDLLHAYLHLLYPVQGSLHAPVSPSHITLAGDSSGASLCLSLIQVILATQKAQESSSPTIMFNGRRVLLPMPAGVAAISAAFDHTLSLPSFEANGATDILGGTLPPLRPDFPVCDIWPSSPPRGQVYCETSAVCHPLVSPTSATSWTGAPPMYFAAGLGERMVDSVKVIARNAAIQEVVVQWDGFELMPHIWPMLFKSWPQTDWCYQRVATACVEFSNGLPMSRSRTLHLDGSESDGPDLLNLTKLDMITVEALMRAKQADMKDIVRKQSNSKAKL